jgi:hypothetical protein
MADIYNHRKVSIRCYDNGGRSADRYTVVYSGKPYATGQYVGMSENPFHPQGVGMHGESRQPIDNRGYGQKGGYAHLGKSITFDDLPPDCQKLVMADCFDFALDWKAPPHPRVVVLQDFLMSYLIAALWSTNDNADPSGGEPLDDNFDVNDIDAKSINGASSECADFIMANMDDLKEYAGLMRNEEYNGWERAGHDFWLTRNGHGVGFWDRGLGALGDRLTAAAKVYGSQDIYVGDDRKLYIAGFENFKEKA